MPKQTKSAALYERALKIMPGGCSRNTILRKPHPIYATKGHGCFVTDIEGKTRVDFANNVASLIHGHAHPKIIAAVSEQMTKGRAFTVGTEAEILHAEHMITRAFTGRAKIAKVEGAYHGLYDYAEVSQTAKPENWGDINHPQSVPVSKGTPQAALDDVVAVPFNDTARALEILDSHKEALAGILLDLLPHRIGVIPAEPDFVAALLKWAVENGALLIIDEVITFRANYGGAQAYYNIRPDLTALGKMIGGGFPVGAIAGRADAMDMMNPLNGPAPFPHYGTFSANPITMTAGRVAMEMFDQDAAKNLNRLADSARVMIADAIKIADVPACVTGRGSMFRIHLKATAPTTYQEAFIGPKEQARMNALLDYLFDNGLLMIETCSGLLSTAMTPAEIEQMADIILRGLRKIKPLM